AAPRKPRRRRHTRSLRAFCSSGDRSRGRSELRRAPPLWSGASSAQAYLSLQRNTKFSTGSAASGSEAAAGPEAVVEIVRRVRAHAGIAALARAPRVEPAEERAVVDPLVEVSDHVVDGVVSPVAP